MISLPSLSLLADQSKFHNLGNRFRRGTNGFDAGDLVVILGIFAILALVTWIMIQCAVLINNRKRNSPIAMFFTLCQAHRIEWISRWLLWKLAQAHQLQQPAQLFIDPRLFDPKLLVRLPPDHRRRLEKVRDRIFAGAAGEG